TATQAAKPASLAMMLDAVAADPRDAHPDPSPWPEMATGEGTLRRRICLVSPLLPTPATDDLSTVPLRFPSPSSCGGCPAVLFSNARHPPPPRTRSEIAFHLANSG